MDRQTVLKYIEDRHLIERLASSNSSKLGDLKDDYIQHMWMIVCEMPDEKLIDLFDKHQIEYYIYSVARNQAWNDKSTFWKSNRHLSTDSDDIERIISNEDKEQ